jgi:hypothetical protein
MFQGEVKGFPSTDAQQHRLNEKEPFRGTAIFLSLPLLDPVFIEHANLNPQVRIRETKILACNNPQPLPDISNVAC